jgi:hypothetical protein
MKKKNKSGNGEEGRKFNMIECKRLISLESLLDLSIRTSLPFLAYKSFAQIFIPSQISVFQYLQSIPINILSINSLLGNAIHNGNDHDKRDQASLK